MPQATRPQHIALANVLVSTDFSPASHTALLYALSLARRYGASLYLAHVVHQRNSPDSPNSAVENAWREGQRLTTDLLVSGQLRGIHHKLLVGQGEIWEGLAPMIAENHVDLLVVGTRGRSGIAKMLMGSVAELIFRQATCPVLTVGPHTVEPSDREDALRRILYATDFTPQSLHALDYAISLARQYDAQLVLLNVVNEEALSQGTRDQAEARLRALVMAGTLKHEVVVSAGAPAPRILDVAQEMRPDLIVLGVTHPQTGAIAVRRWSVAAEVTANAACPVLTVRAA